MKFNPALVLTALNAELLRPGDKVYLADSLSELKEKVVKGSDKGTTIILQINPEESVFRFNPVNEDVCYNLAYLVDKC